MLHKWCTCLKEPLLTNHETRKSNQKVAIKKTVSGRENNNNQNFRTKSANILSSVLCNVSRRHNKSGQDNIQVPVEQKMVWKMP